LKLVIMQPCYLPWRGLFSQIKIADHFVFLDHAQLPAGGGKGKGFISRVEVKTQHGVKWLTVPVRKVPGGIQSIAEARIEYTQDWRPGHRSTLEHALSRAEHWPSVRGYVAELFDRRYERLGDLLMDSTVELASMLGLTTPISRSSELNLGTHKTELVLDICHHFGATTYVTGSGARNYLGHEEFEAEGIAVEYVRYRLDPYPQMWGDFTPYVTILDLIANVGPHASELLDASTVPWREAVAH
jgi:hypothetical protein